MALVGYVPDFVQHWILEEAGGVAELCGVVLDWQDMDWYSTHDMNKYGIIIKSA